MPFARPPADIDRLRIGITSSDVFGRLIPDIAFRRQAIPRLGLCRRIIIRAAGNRLVLEDVIPGHILAVMPRRQGQVVIGRQRPGCGDHIRVVGAAQLIFTGRIKAPAIGMPADGFLHRGRHTIAGVLGLSRHRHRLSPD